MEMPAAQQVAVINALAPRLQAAGLDVKILGFDHNWLEHPADVAAVPAGGDPELDYATRVLSSSAAPNVAGTAFHCYYGDATAQEPLHAAFPSKEIWVTECSGSHGPTDTPATYFADTLAWQTRNLMIASLQHWATTVLTWNLDLDASGGPHTGGCSACTGVVTVQNGQVTPDAEYYVLAHASRFLPRGSVRLGSSASVTGLPQVAFRTPDGTVVVLVQNASAQAAPVTVTIGGTAYDVTLPARSTVTVRITA
jgi:glucosylceramidase